MSFPRKLICHFQDNISETYLFGMLQKEIHHIRTNTLFVSEDG